MAKEADGDLQDLGEEKWEEACLEISPWRFSGQEYRRNEGSNQTHTGQAHRQAP